MSDQKKPDNPQKGNALPGAGKKPEERESVPTESLLAPSLNESQASPFEEEEGALKETLPGAESIETVKRAPSTPPRRRTRYIVEEGASLGPYNILSELGRGGMGVVYKGYHQNLGRYVGLKVLPDHLAENPDLVARFQIEARAAARLIHPNIAVVYEIGEIEGVHFFAMEYVEGSTLSEIIRKKGDLPFQEAVEYMKQASDALGYAHRQGVIHRDIKPSNLMVNPEGHIKVMDFGLARIQDEDNRLTMTGMTLGTPSYMSPEQAGSESCGPLDHRADIYALGVVLFELTTGRLPFEGKSKLDVMRKIIDHEAPAPTAFRNDVPHELEEIITKAMQKQVEDRFSTAKEMQEALAAIQIQSTTETILSQEMPEPSAAKRSKAPQKEPKIKDAKKGAGEPSASSSLPKILAISAAVFIIAAIGFLAFSKGREERKSAVATSGTDSQPSQGSTTALPRILPTPSSTVSSSPVRASLPGQNTQQTTGSIADALSAMQQRDYSSASQLFLQLREEATRRRDPAFNEQLASALAEFRTTTLDEALAHYSAGHFFEALDYMMYSIEPISDDSKAKLIAIAIEINDEARTDRPPMPTQTGGLQNPGFNTQQRNTGRFRPQGAPPPRRPTGQRGQQRPGAQRRQGFAPGQGGGPGPNQPSQYPQDGDNQRPWFQQGPAGPNQNTGPNQNSGVQSRRRTGLAGAGPLRAARLNIQQLNSFSTHVILINLASFWLENDLAGLEKLAQWEPVPGFTRQNEAFKKIYMGALIMEAGQQGRYDIAFSIYMALANVANVESEFLGTMERIYSIARGLSWDGTTFSRYAGISDQPARYLGVKTPFDPLLPPIVHLLNRPAEPPIPQDERYEIYLMARGRNTEPLELYRDLRMREAEKPTPQRVPRDRFDRLDEVSSFDLTEVITAKDIRTPALRTASYQLSPDSTFNSLIPNGRAMVAFSGDVPLGDGNNKTRKVVVLSDKYESVILIDGDGDGKVEDEIAITPRHDIRVTGKFAVETNETFGFGFDHATRRLIVKNIGSRRTTLDLNGSSFDIALLDLDADGLYEDILPESVSEKRNAPRLPGAKALISPDGGQPANLYRESLVKVGEDFYALADMTSIGSKLYWQKRPRISRKFLVQMQANGDNNAAPTGYEALCLWANGYETKTGRIGSANTVDLPDGLVDLYVMASGAIPMRGAVISRRLQTPEVSFSLIPVVSDRARLQLTRGQLVEGVQISSLAGDKQLSESQPSIIKEIGLGWLDGNPQIALLLPFTTMKPTEGIRGSISTNGFVIPEAPQWEPLVPGRFKIRPLDGRLGYEIDIDIRQRGQDGITLNIQAK